MKKFLRGPLLTRRERLFSAMAFITKPLSFDAFANADSAALRLA